jgi:hypothetical protein
MKIFILIIKVKSDIFMAGLEEKVKSEKKKFFLRGKF